MRILLVDDESSVLQVLMATLRTMPGNEVRVAANAQKAHEHAAAMGGVDLLITDVVMEPTDGFTLRGELQSMYPRMRVVFISGYDLSDYSEQTAGAYVLAKPVDSNLLRAVVTESVTDMAAVAVNRAPVAAVPQAAAVPQPVAQPAPVSDEFAATQVVRLPAPTPSRPGARPAAAAPTPQAVPVPQAAPAPQAVPVAQAAARPSAATPQAVPQATARPAAATPVARAAAPVAAPTLDNSGDPLIGVQLGDYRVQKWLGRGTWGSAYLAIQMSVNRPVGLKVLDPGLAEEESNRAQFLADARAKAAVQHPFIISVFEADERNGLIFYTHEHIDGPTLEDMIAESEQVDEKTALHIMKVAGEGLNYLASHNLAHSSFRAESIRIGRDGLPRLANLATSTLDPRATVQSEIQLLAGVIQRILPQQMMSPGIRALLGRMTGGGANAAATWPVVLQAVKALEPKVIPMEAAKIKAADAAAMKAVEDSRKAQRKALIWSICTLTVLTLTVAFLIWRFLMTDRRDLTAQVEIPAGSYIVGPPGAQTTVELGAYEIDKYEVTIHEFEEFAKYLKEHPDDEHKWDHPSSNQKHMPHISQEVQNLIKTAHKRGGHVFERGDVDPGVEVSMNSPIVGISWWTAYAYANWRGRELPSEEEWEVAARGKSGGKYPWGDEPTFKKMNSNEGFQPLNRGFKPADSFNYWADADAFKGDVSPFGVVGMGGNVAEWVYKMNNRRQEAVVKGGSFATPPIPMYDRLDKLPVQDGWFVFPASEKRGGQENYFVGDPVTAGTRTLYIGFRTVKHK